MVLKDDNINQTMLVPLDLRNLIPEDHPCYFIKNVVDLIDCSKANQEFRGKPGEFAYSQELLLRLVLMSVFDGGLSSREIERKTRTETKRLQNEIRTYFRKQQKNKSSNPTCL